MICKKVTRNVIPLMLSMVFVFSSFSIANAASYLTYTSHGYAGNLSWVTETVENASTGNPSSGTGTLTGTLFLTDMTINWGSPQSGTFTIKLSGYNSGNVFLCENCRLTNYGVSDNGTGSATFSVSGQDYVRIYYYHANVAQTPTGFSGDWNRVAVSEIDAIKQIYTYMTQYMYDSTNGYSYLGHIDGTLTTMTNYVNNIQNTLSNVYSSVDNIESYIDGLETSLTNINSLLDWANKQDILLDFRPWQYFALNWCCAVRGLDTAFYINKGIPCFYYGTNLNDSQYTNSKRIVIPKGDTFVFYCISDGSITTSNTNLYYDGNQTATLSVEPLYSFIGSAWNSYCITLKNNSSTLACFVEMELGCNSNFMPIYLGSVTNVPDEVYSMFGQEYNNTYTRLLQGVINAVGTISQTQIVENNTNINNYNSYQTQINNVENNYYNQFNTHETNIENNNTFNFDGLSSDGVTVYNDVFTNAFNISLVKWPVMIILLGLVIVIILG